MRKTHGVVSCVGKGTTAYTLNSSKQPDLSNREGTDVRPVCLLSYTQGDIGAGTGGAIAPNKIIREQVIHRAPPFFLYFFKYFGRHSIHW